MDHPRFFLFRIYMKNNTVIIVAAGKGSRMQSSLPKQFLLLNGKPIVMHTIELFEPMVSKIILVLHPDMENYWNKLCAKFSFSVTHEICYGGETRFQSVRNGLHALTQASERSTAIAIHDAARPLTNPYLIKKSFEMAHLGISNVLAMPSSSSIRVGDINSSQAIDRNKIWIVQTPQTFPANLIIEAYKQPERAEFTDDASVVEILGNPIHLLKSNQKNIKITYPEDIEIAQIYLKIS